MTRIRIAMPINVAPSGFPMLRNRVVEFPLLLLDDGGARRISRRDDDDDDGGDSKWFEEISEDVEVLSSQVIVLFSRKSCVTAMPMEAKERDVRSHARNVRSRHVVQISQLFNG